MHGQPLCILLISALLLTATSVFADYKLQAGDTLEISITGIPELRQRAPIGVEGEIAAPLVGQISVRGLSVSDARAKITQALSNRHYQQRTPDGREIVHLILPDAVIVTVADYRPIYVNGDVTRPGEQPFRPGMRVRHALAVAGGFDLMRFRVANPFLQSSDFRSEYEALWIEFAREQARIWRLRNEVGERGVEYPSRRAAVPPDVHDRLMKAETEHLKARTADREKDKALLQEAIKRTSVQLSTLEEKRKKDEEGNQADMADFEKVRELYQRGITASQRLSETRRAALLSSDQLLQTIVESSNVERQRGEYIRQLEKLDNQSRIDAWRELQDANLRLGQITARLQSATEKLTYSGLLQSQLARGKGGQPEIAVHRSGEKGPELLKASEDLELAPGDVIDVKLEADMPVEALMR